MYGGCKKIKEDSETLFDPKFPDVLSKTMKSQEKIDLRSQYLSTVTDLIRVINSPYTKIRNKIR